MQEQVGEEIGIRLSLGAGVENRRKGTETDQNRRKRTAIGEEAAYFDARAAGNRGVE